MYRVFWLEVNCIPVVGRRRKSSFSGWEPVYRRYSRDL